MVWITSTLKLFTVPNLLNVKLEQQLWFTMILCSRKAKFRNKRERNMEQALTIRREM